MIAVNDNFAVQLRLKVLNRFKSSTIDFNGILWFYFRFQVSIICINAAEQFYKNKRGLYTVAVICGNRRRDYT